jgi:3-deoxy-D-manno-octulosonic-acid transferase
LIEVCGEQALREGRKVAFLAYNIAVFLILPLAIAFLAVQVIIHRRYRESVIPRLGFLPRTLKESPQQESVFWIHAVSVGEVMAAAPLVKRLRQSYPQARLLVSTITQTGQATAAQKLPEADEIFYFPYDLPWIVAKVIRKISPSIFIFLETEIWPNFLFALAQERIPAVMVNGRLSSGSYKGYRLLLPFFRKVLGTVSLFSVQTDLDRERLVALGVDPRKVVRTGNMKYDQAIVSSSEGPEDVKKGLKLPTSCRLIMAGSTHEGEEEAITACYRKLVRAYPNTRLMLAPRHLDRLEKIEGLLHRQGFMSVRKTKVESAAFSVLPPETVILLDTLGELQRLYSAASLVFVGGSLVPVGGHNVLEPAACAKPILFGPYMENFKEIAQYLMEKEAACQVADADRLFERMLWLLEDPLRADVMGGKAREVVLEQQGVVEKNLDLIHRVLGQRR